MSDACLAIPPADSALIRLSTFLDCQADALGNAAFRGGTGTGILPGLLGTAMIIYVAVIGYRLIFNERTDTRFIVMAVVRLAMVMALMTSWNAFSTLVLRPAMAGPPDLAGQLLGSTATGLFGQESYPVRVQGILKKAHEVLAKETQNGQNGVPGQGPAAGQMSQSAAPPGAAAASTPSQPDGTGTAVKKPDSISDLGMAGWAFILVTIGLTGALRLVVGLLLGVSPLFLIAALFDNAQGLFEGWVKAVVGTAMATSGAMVSGMLLIQYSEGELARKIATPEAMLPVSDILALNTLVFGCAGFIMIMAGYILGSRFRLRAARAMAMDHGSSAVASTVSEISGSPRYVEPNAPATSPRTARMVGRIMSHPSDRGGREIVADGRLPISPVQTSRGGMTEASPSPFAHTSSSRRSTTVRKGPGATRREAR